MSNTPDPSAKIERYLDCLLHGKRDELPELTPEEAEVVRFFLQRRAVESPPPEFLQRLEQTLVARTHLKPTSPRFAFLRNLAMPSFWLRHKSYALAGLSMLLIALIGASTLAPWLFGLSDRPEVSAQTILNKLATNIESRQGTDQIIHRRVKSTYCSNLDPMTPSFVSSSYYTPWMSAADDTPVNENGFRCSGDVVESWEGPDSNLFITYNQSGELSGLSMEHEGWSYQYTAGASKAWKRDNNLIQQRMEEAGSEFYGMPLEDTYEVEVVDNAMINQLNATLSSSNAKLQSDQDNALLELRERYGDVRIEGEETIGRYKTWKLTYDYDELPSAEFNVGFSNAIVVSEQGNSSPYPMVTEKDTAPSFDQYTTTFWVDQESFEQVRFEESVLVNGVKQITYQTEFELDELLPLEQTDEVFRFPLPEGVELMDTTELEIAAYLAELESQEVSVAELIQSSEVGVWFPGYIPPSLQLNYVGHYDNGFNAFDFMFDFMPAADAEAMRQMSLEAGESLSLGFYPDKPGTEERGSNLVQYVDLMVTTMSPEIPEHLIELVGIPEEELLPNENLQIVNIAGNAGELELFESKEGTDELFGTLSWEMEGLYFSLSAQGLDAAELVRIAESVQRVTAQDTTLLESIQTVLDQVQSATPSDLSESAVEESAGPKPSLYLPTELPEGLVISSIDSFDSNYVSIALRSDALDDSQFLAQQLYIFVERFDETAAEDGFSKTPEDWGEGMQVEAIEINGYPGQLVYQDDDEVIKHLAWQQEGERINLTATGFSNEALLAFARSLNRIPAEQSASYLSTLEAQLEPTN